MEIESFEHTLLTTLTHKSSDSLAYKKALTIYNSVLQSSQQIPNFRSSIANSNNNFALFVFGSVYKILVKDSCEMRHNIQSLLLLINQTLPYLNVSVLRLNNVMQELQAKVYSLITQTNSEQKTALMLRYAMSILSFTLLNTHNIDNNKQSTSILWGLFESAVASHRTNTLSKESSKILTHLTKNNPKVAVILSRYANLSMLSNLQSNLYLNNVREVIAEFPVQQINDIGYRVAKYLSTVQCNTQDDEIYLSQIYFFLEKLMNKFSSSTLQEVCTELINNVPSVAQHDSKFIFCYLQALHMAIQNLVTMNEKFANQHISAVMSILQEFITKGGQIEKQGIGILKSMMSNCIRKSLWAGKQTCGGLEFLGLDDLTIHNDPQQGHNLTKIVCMLQAMLSDEFQNHKGTASILSSFFESLDQTAFEASVPLISKVVEFRQKFDDRSFRNVMHEVFMAVGIERICKMYPMSVSGDVADPAFEARNNLWLASCTQKYEGEGHFDTYMQNYFPLLLSIQTQAKRPALSSVRKQAYRALKELIWRCLKIFCHKASPKHNYSTLVESLKTQIPIASDSFLDHISIALQNLCSSLRKSQFKCQWSGNLISLLAKNLDLQKPSSKQILNAMKHLSTIADPQYLNRVFDKNIVKLIGHKSKGEQNSNDNTDSNLKNLEILIAVSNGIDFNDSSVVAPYQVSREELVIRLIGELVSSGSLFQKKAYKYILQALPLMGHGFRSEVNDMIDSLDHAIIPASKHYHMSILTLLWKQTGDDLNNSFAFIKKHLPQIMLNMRDPNQRTRKTSNSLFEGFCSRLHELGLTQNFMEMICAGLATDSTSMKVATLNALALIFAKKLGVDFEFSVGILQIVLLLLYEKNGEIYKAIIDYSRRFIFSIEKAQGVKAVTKTVLQQLFRVDSASKLEYRSILKHFLLKLVKKLGRETVEAMIPSEDRKVLSNAIKTENRQKRKKKEKRARHRAEMEKARAEEQKSESSIEDQDDDAMAEEMQEEQNEELKELKNPDNMLLKYDLDQENFHFEEQKVNIKAQIKKTRREHAADTDDVTFGQDGEIIVRDQRRTRDRQRQPEDQEDGLNPVGQSHLNTKKRRKLNDVHTVKQSGQSFKSRKAGGDLYHKDKPEPYAFIQFNSKALNKRFKKRAEKVFEDIFEKHEGGLKGIRSSIAHKHRF